MIGLDKYHHIQMSINIQEEVYKNVYAKEIEKENYMYLNFSILVKKIDKLTLFT